MLARIDISSSSHYVAVPVHRDKNPVRECKRFPKKFLQISAILILPIPTSATLSACPYTQLKVPNFRAPRVESAYKGSNLLWALPDSFYARLPHHLAAQEAAQHRNQSRYFIECGRFLRYTFSMSRYAACYSYRSNNSSASRSDRYAPHQASNSPCHHHIDRQCTFEFFDRRQLKRFGATAAFEHMEEHFNLPACSIPVNKLYRCINLFLAPVFQIYYLEF